MNIAWQTLTNSSELEAAIKSSSSKPIVLFKHSTRCSISSMALNRLDNKWDKINSKADLYYLDLLEYRNISNEIAERTGVEHESPQLILMVNGKPAYVETHSGISIEDLSDAIDGLES